MTAAQIPPESPRCGSLGKTIDNSPVQVVHERTVDLCERYYELSRLGRETFCASVAQATLVRTPAAGTQPGHCLPARTGKGTAMDLGTGSGIAHLPATADGAAVAGNSLSRLTAGAAFSTEATPPQEFIPLAKKRGTPFVDLITVGRTDGNDIVIPDLSVSRFQAFFRRRHGRWFVCDAGSSNGTLVNGTRLVPRTEAEVQSDSALRFGAVEFRFHTADSLYDILASRHMHGPDVAGANKEWA